ncbi:hypothetical protein SLA2020_486990 [Shorea laevis]
MTSAGETASSRSLLDKPLHQLTEDDISQLTREDCRKYLKEKGMRRPSWNKSQAIQQVISLKTLLEPPSDSDAAEARKKLYIPRPDNPPRAASLSAVSVKETTSDTVISLPAEDSVTCGHPDPPESDPSGDIGGRDVAVKDDSVSPRTTTPVDEPLGQMTIFYCGKVNVYDDVPACKAQAMLQLAASSLPFPQENVADQSTTPCSFPCHLLQAASPKVGPGSLMVTLPTPQTVKLADNWQLPRVEINVSHDNSLESPTYRKASVQRYLEKRKDR